MATRRKAADYLRLGREQALSMADRVGVKQVDAMLREAARELEGRLASAVAAGSTTPTGVREMQETLGQLRDVIRTLQGRLGKATVEVGKRAAEEGAGTMVDYLQGTSKDLEPGRPLALREASMFSRAVAGAEASILARLAGEPGGYVADEGEAIAAQNGVLARYGAATIQSFEDVLRNGMLTRKPWGDVRDELVGKSPFLQGAPRSWAERIVRTETMGAYNRAGWESIRAADDELGDMVKILSATFDSRTAWDSYQVHGQIRLPDQAFAWNGGLYQAPPNRPNDREVVVPHRLSWPLPPDLAWRSDAEVMAAWKRDRRLGSPPPRPQMTTVPLSSFGKG